MEILCPYCGSLMKSGRAEIHGTTLGFLVAGFSYENLYFKTEDEKEIRILESQNSTPSLRCPNCEILILNKSDSETFVKIDDSEFTKLTRDSIFGLIALWAHKDQQIEYKKKFPEINLSEELFYQWRDSFVDDSEDFKNSFRAKELNILNLFDWEITKILTQFNSEIPEYSFFVETDNWRKLNSIAKEILIELK
jgi:hypothetical protein